MRYRLGVTEEHRRQLAAQRDTYKKQLQVQSKQQAPPKPGNGKQIVQKPTYQPQETPRSERKPIELSLLELTKVELVVAKKKLKRVKYVDFMRRHNRFIDEIAEKPVDVRFLAIVIGWFGGFVVRRVHTYANGREFLLAHRGGFCNIKVRKARKRKCKPCEWSYKKIESEYCRGCDCGETRISNLDYKRRLAKFLCPKKKFKIAPGWLSRVMFYKIRLPRRDTRKVRKQKR